MAIVERKEYLDELMSWKDEKVIKVVTGIRRSGKSTLLRQFQAKLKATGVKEDRIISLNFEDIENEDYLDYRKLYSYLLNHLKEDEMTYIFLDEVERVIDFQKCVDSLYLKDNVDIYITGSNAYLLSGELATILSGRYVEISILPLSFKEFLNLNSYENRESAFRDYMKYGSFPYVSTMNDRTEEKVYEYIDAIFNTVVVKDILDRAKYRDSRNINDTILLKNIARYLSSSIGSPMTVKNIANYLISSGRKISANTVNDDINALIESYLFYAVDRFDINIKELLKTNKKLYIVDLGLRNYLIAKRQYDLGFSIENIVFLELKRRKYNIT